MLFAWCGAQFPREVSNSGLIALPQGPEEEVAQEPHEEAQEAGTNTSWEALWWFSPFQNKGTDSCTE